jgi:PST family polysaccharide transporter
MGTLLLSLGESRRYLRWGCAHAAAVLLSFAIGIRWGPMGIATSYAICNAVTAIPSIVYCTRASPVTLRDVASAIWPAAFAASFAYTVGILVFPSSGQYQLETGILRGMVVFLTYVVMGLILGLHERLLVIATAAWARTRDSPGT